MQDIENTGRNLRIGRYEITATGGEKVRAYIPPPLPPSPPILIDSLLPLLEKANRALGRLDGMAAILPDKPLFIYMYVRKEALLSSQIEGTQSSLSELLLFENEELQAIPTVDVREVSNYVAALQHGLKRIEEGFPLSLRLIREIHAVLLADGRGSDKQPGEFRTSQNWIGGTRPGNATYVPPPHTIALDCLGDLETFIHSETTSLPLLIKAGLVHVQFESIHPFLDGNGRLGRLLITFLLCAAGALNDPILYLSLYFKQHRERYYALLQEVREKGAWEAWLEFFLTGIVETSEQATETAGKILGLFADDRVRIEKLGRAAGSASLLHQWMQRHPVFSIPMAVRELGLSHPTVSKAVTVLMGEGIVRQIDQRRRDRNFVYSAYLDLLSQGTEPLG
jgi:Fic family protein